MIGQSEHTGSYNCLSLTKPGFTKRLFYSDSGPQTKKKTKTCWYRKKAIVHVTVVHMWLGIFPTDSQFSSKL